MPEKNKQTNKPGRVSDGRSVTDVAQFFIRVDLSALKINK